MSRFSVKLGDDNGRARIILCDRGEVVGILNISWISYEAMVRELMQLLLQSSRGTLATGLATILWENAQRESEESIELAKQKLAALGITQPKIDQWADHLARSVLQTMVGHLPKPEGV